MFLQKYAMLILNDHGLVNLKDFMAISSQRYCPKLLIILMWDFPSFKSCHHNFQWSGDSGYLGPIGIVGDIKSLIC